MKNCVKIVACLLITLLAMVACGKDNNETVNSTGLEGTEWNFERTVEGNSVTTRHWGAMRFISNTSVEYTTGRSERSNTSNGSGSQSSETTSESTQTYSYTFDGSTLAIQIPQPGLGASATTRFAVDLRAGTITQTYIGTERITDNPVIYHRR